jgi:hypothetical protein
LLRGQRLAWTGRGFLGKDKERGRSKSEHGQISLPTGYDNASLSKNLTFSFPILINCVKNQARQGIVSFHFISKVYLPGKLIKHAHFVKLFSGHLDVPTWVDHVRAKLSGWMRMKNSLSASSVILGDVSV